MENISRAHQDAEATRVFVRVAWGKQGLLSLLVQHLGERKVHLLDYTGYCITPKRLKVAYSHTKSPLCHPGG